MNFGGPTHCKETLPHVSHVIIRFWIHHACKYLVSYPATTVEGTSGSSIPRHFGNTNKKRREEKRREGREIYTWKIKFGEEKGDP